MKRRVPSEAPSELSLSVGRSSSTDLLLVRASPRIASLHRSTTYVDLDGNPIEDPSDDDDEYDSDQDQDDEEEFRPSKRSKGGYRGGSNPRRNTSHSNKRVSRHLDHVLLLQLTYSLRRERSCPYIASVRLGIKYLTYSPCSTTP